MRNPTHPTADLRIPGSSVRSRPHLFGCVPLGLVALLLAACAKPNPGIAELPARKLDECPVTRLENLSRLDVAIAIDTSTNSADPSGFDIDENGIVGVFRNSTMTDRGDSLLAAQVVGIKSLIADERLREMRFSIISYSGRIRNDNDQAIPPQYVPRQVAQVRSQLTTDAQELEAALDRVLRRGSWGTVDYAPALRQSLKELRRGVEEDEGGLPRRQVVVFMSNTPYTLRPGSTVVLYQTRSGDPNGAWVRTDPDLKATAMEANQRAIRIQTIGVGDAATVPPPHLLSLVAGATGGVYRAVEDATRIHCALLAALAPPPEIASGDAR